MGYTLAETATKMVVGDGAHGELRRRLATANGGADELRRTGMHEGVQDVALLTLDAWV